MYSQLTMEHLEASGSPRESGGGGSAASSRSHACLDQFAPMLPSNPVQQLPLLPTASCTTSTVRVAAWLLEQGGEGEEHHCMMTNDWVGAAYSVQDAAPSCGEAEQGDVEDVEELLAGMADEAAAQQAQQETEACAAAKAAAAGVVCGGRRGRASLDLFMSAPVQHGDALNNYVASLY